MPAVAKCSGLIEATSLLTIAVNKDIEHIIPKGILYEPPALVENKTLEYAYELEWFGLQKFVAVEVKTIETDPESREEQQLILGNKYVKPYFNGLSLDELKNREDYASLTFLESSTHFRQVSKNIRGINNKFEEHSQIINIGVIIFQYATGMEEMLSYLFNPRYGVYIRHPEYFSNIDNLTIFSLTQTPDLQMQELYDRGHVLSLCLTNEHWKIDILKTLRLDNFIFFDGVLTDWVEPHIEDDFGIFSLEVYENIKFFHNEKNDINEARRNAHIASSKLIDQESAKVISISAICP